MKISSFLSSPVRKKKKPIFSPIIPILEVGGRETRDPDVFTILLNIAQFPKKDMLCEIQRNSLARRRVRI